MNDYDMKTLGLPTKEMKPVKNACPSGCESERCKRFWKEHDKIWDRISNNLRNHPEIYDIAFRIVDP